MKFGIGLCAVVVGGMGIVGLCDGSTYSEPGLLAIAIGCVAVSIVSLAALAVYLGIQVDARETERDRALSCETRRLGERLEMEVQRDKALSKLGEAQAKLSAAREARDKLNEALGDE